VVFSSTVFLFLFLPAVLLAHALLPRRCANAVLLGSSLLFYACGEGGYVLLMLGSIAMNYAFGLAVAGRGEAAAKKRIVGLAVAANLALLAAFKYANFLAANLDVLLAALALPTIALDPVHLPIGISFFTFQALSYVIDVERGDAAPQRDPLGLALYVSLFPQLIAGPIVRYRHVAEQIASRRVDLELFVSGVTRFSIGLGKKVLIANALATPADQVFGAPEAELTAALAWFGALCYGLQIYFDFSGYSDMAIGLGRMFGFHFRENFLHPYVASSVTEFWRRWHVSLSTWFRDYLYVPLGGNRRGPWITYRNLLIVFLLCGLWHGAAWSFVVWGLWHGAFLILERQRALAPLAAAPWPLRHGYLLLVVLIGWVFFRADDLGAALAHLAAMAGAGIGDGRVLAVSHLVDPALLVALAAGIVGSLPIGPWLDTRVAAARERGASATFELMIAASRSAMVALVLALSAAALASGTHNPFIYFRF
jgi:alginate O-acetyltransferase complex protein AlgI